MEDLVEGVRRLLGRAPGTVTALGGGTDHEAYDVDGVFVVRRQRDPDDDPTAVDREARLLAVVASVSPVPVPEVVATDPRAGLLVVRKLPGTSLLDDPPTDPTALVDQVTAFLLAVHGLPERLVAGLVEYDDDPLDVFLAEAAETLPRVAPALSPDARRGVERFLASPAPAEPSAVVFCHHDLGAEHLLVGRDRGTLTGVIDWSDAALTDPARDLGRLYRDLGPEFAARVCAGSDTRGDAGLLDRAAFLARCFLLEDLAFGLDTGDRRYTDAALRHLARTFA
ncbi:phosphotransferase family protein [Micromonospora cathayae]|uniref:Phosphotransferase n=1 Tax=Micromonospora cathayae TaxID=3028804 RepID=A0ABY7ZJY3_9ACTN|nr:phosphotransferase [Micromonospora sp. HUAS 3]WDZ83302.1 phosphotransferase [Micromonospora sp. HUAS 3]